MVGMESQDVSKLTYKIIGAAIEVHQTLGGPSLLEDIYEEALCRELFLRDIRVQRQVGFKAVYKGRELSKRLVLDVLVDDTVIVEVKAVDRHHHIFELQLLTYLRMTNKPVGLVINFGMACVKDGVSRVVNRTGDSPIQN